MLEAMNWGACSLDISHAIFETDRQTAREWPVDKIGHVHQAITELDAIILDIQHLMSRNSHFSVSFIPRQANSISHVLATRCLLLDDCMDLYHVPPCVAAVLFNEMA